MKRKLFCDKVNWSFFLLKIFSNEPFPFFFNSMKGFLYLSCFSLKSYLLCPNMRTVNPRIFLVSAFIYFLGLLHKFWELNLPWAMAKHESKKVKSDKEKFSNKLHKKTIIQPVERGRAELIADPWFLSPIFFCQTFRSTKSFLLVRVWQKSL